MTPEQLGKLLRRDRVAANLPIDEAAELGNVCSSAVYSWEKGDNIACAVAVLNYWSAVQRVADRHTADRDKEID